MKITLHLFLLQISCGLLKIPANDGECGFEISIDKEQFTARGQSKVTAREEAAIKTLLNTTYCFTEIPAELQNHSYSNAQQHSKSDIKPDARSSIKSDNQSDIKADDQSDIKSESQSDIKSSARLNIKSYTQSDIKSDARSELHDNMDKVLDMFENDVKESLELLESHPDDDNTNSETSQTDKELQSLRNETEVQVTRDKEEALLDKESRGAHTANKGGLFIPRSLQVERKDTSTINSNEGHIEQQPAQVPSNNTRKIKQVHILLSFL